MQVLSGLMLLSPFLLAWERQVWRNYLRFTWHYLNAIWDRVDNSFNSSCKTISTPARDVSCDSIYMIGFMFLFFRVKLNQYCALGFKAFWDILMVSKYYPRAHDGFLFFFCKNINLNHFHIRHIGNDVANVLTYMDPSRTSFIEFV